MKSLMPWFCLVAATASAQVAFATDGLDAYRQGDYAEAAEKLANSVNKDPIADYYMGRMRLYGYGQLKSNMTAIRYFKQAAEKGFLPAQHMMARYALLIDNNPEQALHWFKKAADANDTKAQMYCAAAYLFGLGTKKNQDMARRYYIAAARNGDSIAQTALAANFLDSRQLPSRKLGLIWLNKAVEQHNPEAQLRLGELYANGTLVDRDLDKAKELFGLSVAQGYVPALVQMGDLAREQGDLEQAKAWYTKATDVHYAPGEMAMAKLYMQDKTPLYDLHTGFLWMLKAAQNGSNAAQLALVAMYKNGQGVEANPTLAQEWQKKASSSAQDSPLTAQIKAAQWLSNGKAIALTRTGYQLQGILSPWKNKEALRQNNYNQSPRMDVVTREALYKPKFVMTNPNEIPINDYYDALATSLSGSQQDPLSFPRYAIDKSQQMAELASSLASVTPGQATQQKASGEAVNDETFASQLQGRAVLGDSSAQFTLGQMYQEGVGINKDTQAAIKNYELAAAQQDLKAEYNLSVMYLEGHDVKPDYQQGLALLRDAAFKGNDYAQYALAMIEEQGYRNATGEVVIQPDPEQAMAMYDLAAANSYGPAQFRLAELLVRDKNADMSVAAKQKRNQTIKQLYQGAVSAGVEKAALPLAFFNAMDSDPAKQTEAMEVAKKEANAGNTAAALLLGLMFDRGIAVAANPSEALDWYQKASSNAVGAFVLGTYQSQGTGISKDVEKGKALLQQAADAGLSYAHLNLGVLKQQSGEAFLPELEKALALNNSTAGLLLADYYLSLGNDDKQMNQARDIYQRLAEKGDKNGQLKLGFMFEQGLGGPADAVHAEKWYGAAAEQGQVVAQYLLGHLYQLGRLGNQPDYEAAKKWYSSAQSTYAPAAVALGFVYDTVDDDYQHALASYQRAAEQHDAIGQYNLGLMYEKGKGCPVDFTKAQELYQAAADQGLSKAMVQLAGLYFNGSAGSRDESEALNWYNKAAALGDRDALYQLGLLSETGVGTGLDLASALRYYQQAADKGNAKAMLALARMYQYGLGVAKDNQKAVKYYKDLAATGNAYAQYQLGTLYYQGLDGTRMQGKQLLQQAAENGSTQARKILQLLDTQTQDRRSFIEPAAVSQASASLEEEPADLMYLDAVSAWNRGEERTTRMILNQLVNKFPDYAPAKRAYEQLHQDMLPGIVS